jgi:hypothetical protein
MPTRDTNGRFTSNKKTDEKIANVESVEANETAQTEDFGYWSKLLSQPFDTLAELVAAENARRAEDEAKAKAKETRKADAEVVEQAFKALNAIRKAYKERMTALVAEYNEQLLALKSSFTTNADELKATLAEAEDTYAEALRCFTEKYDSYHLTLKDGDFETTISNQTGGSVPDIDDLMQGSVLRALRALFV